MTGSSIQELPIRHVSVRVPWNDIGWTGHICRNPIGNRACLALPRIAEDRKDDQEQELAGTSWSSDLATNRLPACAAERGAFMSDRPYSRRFNHPYADYESAYKGFRPTTFDHSAYSAACIPFAWMLREKVEGKDNEKGLASAFGLDFDPNREPDLQFNTPWVQQRDNQLALLDSFFSALKPEKSLCFFYAKATPLSEDPRRVIIGVGRVKQIDPHREYEHATDQRPNSVIWERNVHHSIRPDFEDGFVLPYHRLLAISEEDEAFDLSSKIAFAPDDAFGAFSYGSEHLSDDHAIASLMSILRALEALPSQVEFDVTGAIQWVSVELNRIWRMRGPFPGLGSALEAFGVNHGTLVAIEIERALRDENGEWTKDPWSLVKAAIEDPFLLPPAARRYLGIRKLALYRGLKDERRTLLTLLSRFPLSAEQAKRYFEPVERRLARIELEDEEIIENPYLLYEADRRRADPIALETIDRSVFAPESVLDQFPLPGEAPISEPDDPHRVRAIALEVLERSAREEGSTVLPKDELILRIRSYALEPECLVTTDLFDHYATEFKDEIIEADGDDGDIHLQLAHLEDGRSSHQALRNTAGKRGCSARQVPEIGGHLLMPRSTVAVRDERDEAGREEKTIALKELFASRIAVLIGPAGAGKTTLLKALTSIPEIDRDGVLLLAPTGKARVNAICAVAHIAFYELFPVMRWTRPIPL